MIATSSSEEKLEKLSRLGADELINYKTTPNWGEKAKALTDGRGVDHVIEVGGPATFAQSMAACRLGGHIALIGVLSGFAGEVVMPRAVLRTDPRERNLDRQPGRSGRHDSRDQREPADSR